MTCMVCKGQHPARLVFSKEGFEIVRCPSCGLVSRASLPEQFELEKIYDRSYFASIDRSIGRTGYLDYVGDEEAHRTNARRRISLLRTYLEPDSLLDVGCAAGFFVDEAVRAGWRATGIDLSRAMVDWGTTHLGAELHVGGLAGERTTRACITMWDTIEHLLNPRSDLERAHALLRPGGILALSTGDSDSLLARVSLRRWHLMTPRHHNYFFSPPTIRRLLVSLGFEVLSIGHPPSVFPLRYLLHKTGLRGRISLVRRLGDSSVGGLQVPLNLWDVMTVVARRPLAGIS